MAGTLDYGSGKQQLNLIAEEVIEYKFDDDDDDTLFICQLRTLLLSDKVVIGDTVQCI